MSSEFDVISIDKLDKPDLLFPTYKSPIAADSNRPGNVIPNENEKTGKAFAGVAPVAWMVIFGDALHNVIDGILIGVAFTGNVLGGVGVSVTVACEELPHELGDVAILVSCGMTMRQALGFNFLSAVTAYFGFVLGVFIGELNETTVYTFALAAGMFLYVALATLVPEMNRTMEEALDRSTMKGLVIITVQCTGIAMGLSITFLLAYYHSHITF